jgi:hypothetical protein
MSDVRVSTSAIDRFLAKLDDERTILESAPRTHLPTSLPLSFPTPLHTLNILTLLHVLHHTLSHLNHGPYFAQTSSTPLDIVLRGLIGLYLASDEGWGPDNYLSNAFLGGKGMSEEKVVEFFGVEVMREREHESMRGIRVGARWKEGVDIASDLIRVFGVLGSIGSKCIGEAMFSLFGRCKDESGDGEQYPEQFARLFCEEVSSPSGSMHGVTII